MPDATNSMAESQNASVRPSNLRLFTERLLSSSRGAGEDQSWGALGRECLRPRFTAFQLPFIILHCGELVNSNKEPTPLQVHAIWL
jgi:hypothetical protein